MMFEINKIYQGDCREILKTFPDRSVHCIVTSPPYYALRDYGCDGQIGLEKSPEDFISVMVEVFKECKRVLRDDGTLWINIGDSYASGPRNRTVEQANANSTLNGSTKSQEQSLKQINKIVSGLKPKDLIGIPWMLAFALRADGWYLRQDIIWHKPNPMPESVTDRCTKAHEYLFLFSKSSKYFFDAEAIKTEIKAEPYHMMPKGWAVGAGSHSAIDHATAEGQLRKKTNIENRKSTVHNNHAASDGINGRGFIGHSGNYSKEGKLNGDGKANKRSVWTIATQPYSDAHFATFPEELIIDCIKAGSKENGIVLDPFMGAGTTALVASKLQRNFIGIELNNEYINISERRLKQELGMFNPLTTAV